MRPASVYTSDTHPEANDVLLQAVRRMPPVRHVQRTVALSRQLKEMTFAALKRMHPELSEDAIRLLFIEQVYGQELADDVREFLAARSGN